MADPFLKKALNLAVDGTDLEELRAMMELEIDLHEADAEAAARVFDSGGRISSKGTRCPRGDSR